jgi:hypothetical protein
MATPQEIQKVLDKLNSTYKKLGESNPFENYDSSNITDAVKEAQRLNDALAGAQQRLTKICSRWLKTCTQQKRSRTI